MLRGRRAITFATMRTSPAPSAGVPSRGAFGWVEDSRRRLDRAGLGRRTTRRVRGGSAVGGSAVVGSAVVDLSTNDYLGMSARPELVRASAEAAERFGTGGRASRVVSGGCSVHEELEDALAAFCGTEAALVFSSGYLANIGALTALCRPGSLLVCDESNHASLIDGGRLSGAEVVAVAHADPAATAVALAQKGARRAVYATESVFSVEGDAPPLPPFLDACRSAGAGMVVDDAHGFGLVGPGGRGSLRAAVGCQPDVVGVVTLGKALGSQGGAVVGTRQVIRYLVNVARSFVFDTALAPPSAAAALAGLSILRREPERSRRVLHLATRMAELLADARLPVSRPGAAVMSVRSPSAKSAVEWAGRCAERGVLVGCFRPPAVRDGISRIRLGVHAALSDRDVERAASVIVATRPC